MIAVYFRQIHCLLYLTTVCTVNETVAFDENNTVGAEVTSISTELGVTLEITENPDEAFSINGSFLVAIKVLDFEV